MSLVELLMKGGIIMIPIGLLSVFTAYLFIERYLYIRKNSSLERNFMNNIKDLVHQGNVNSAVAFCKSSENAIGRVIEKGLLRIGRPIKEIEGTLESVANIEITKMERNTSYLGIIAGIAPMLGFIGTIMGVIKIFYDISLSDNISIGIIAGGLYTKMITSGAGLVVGVIAYTCYHILTIMIERFTLSLQETSFELTQVLQDPAK